VPFALTAVLFGLIVLATHFIQGITGFGCATLAMPFCILLTDIDTARPVLTVLALVLDVYLLVVSWNHVDWRQYLRILAFVLPGLPIGMVAYNVLPRTTLMHILAIFMVVVGIQGLVTVPAGQRCAANMACVASRQPALHRRRHAWGVHIGRSACHYLRDSEVEG